LRSRRSADRRARGARGSRRAPSTTSLSSPDVRSCGAASYRRRIRFRPLAVGLRAEQLHGTVDPAFLVGVLLPPPATGTLGLAGHHGTCAWRTADRGVPVVEELVVRNFVLADVVPHAVEGPVGERIELDDATVLPIHLDL